MKQLCIKLSEEQFQVIESLRRNRGLRSQREVIASLLEPFALKAPTHTPQPVPTGDILKGITKPAYKDLDVVYEPD